MSGGRGTEGDRLANWHCQTPSVRAAIMQLGIVSNQRQPSPSELTDRWKKRPLRSEMASDQDTSPTTEGPPCSGYRSAPGSSTPPPSSPAARRRNPASRAGRMQPTDRLRSTPASWSDDSPTPPDDGDAGRTRGRESTAATGDRRPTARRRRLDPLATRPCSDD